MGEASKASADIPTKIGLLADFAHPTGYKSLTPDQEGSLREQFRACLHGNKQADVEALLASSAFNPSVPDTDGSGHPGVSVVFEKIVAAVAAYNALATGTTLVAPSDEEPTCVEYEWRNGELIVRYNYETDVESPASCPPAGPPSGHFRCQLAYVMP